jgi:hypothetical protein
MSDRSFDFAVIGINHGHIYGQVDQMLDAGCRLTKFLAPEDDLAAAFAKAYPQAARVTDEAAILDDLRWLGLDWPRPVMRQSTRQPAYRAALHDLARRLRPAR